MKTSRVTVKPYDEKWSADFEAIKLELQGALGELALAIEHVGSTSVVGLSAKPCIDIDVVIEYYSVLDEVVRALSNIGYVHEGDLGISGREAFDYSDKPHLAKHHLYVCPKDSAELKRHLAFRDFLRSDPDAMQKYGRVKEEAARRFPNDIDGYMAYKSSCIEEIDKICGLK